MSKTFTGYAADADDRLAELVAEVTGGDHDGSDVTFGSLLDRWLKHASVLKGLSPTTIREHKRTIEKTIKPVLGDVPLRELDGRTLDSFYAALMTREHPLSASSVRRCHAVIAAATKQGVKWKEIKIQDDPARDATPPTIRRAPKGVPTIEQFDALVAAARAEDCRYGGPNPACR